jgi:endoglucanase
MTRRKFLSTQAGWLGALGTSSLFAHHAEPNGTREPPRRGVSLAGPEFGSAKAEFSNLNPGVCGRDYTYNSEATFAYFCSHNLRLLRLPLRWERLQPRLNQPLEEMEIRHLKTAIGWARKHGGVVILDIHNYCRYIMGSGRRRCECVIDKAAKDSPQVNRDHFADLWRRLARLFRDNNAVYAYGLMNEPHDLGTSNWRKISQTAVKAIREENDSKLILIAGDGWSNAQRFGEINGQQAWVNDPANNVAYEAHCYFDHDSSGHYHLSFDEELTRDARLETRGVARLQPFVQWCRSNRVRGFLGEFGIPSTDARWEPVLSRFLAALDRAEMEGCYWAAGEWWGANPLSIQPNGTEQRSARQLRLLMR